MKICSKCDLEKELNGFHKRSPNQDGYNNICKICRNRYNRENYNSGRSRKYYLSNKEEIKNKSKEYKKLYKVLNKEKLKEKRKEYRLKNKEKLKIKNKIYKENNRDKINRYRREFRKAKYQVDPFFKLIANIRCLISNSFRYKYLSKKSKTCQILGCSYGEFISYMESKFEPWMNWDNYGKYNGELNYGWDIDHIIPSSMAKNEEELFKLNHHTNLQPLCSYTNRHIKSNKCAAQ